MKTNREQLLRNPAVQPSNAVIAEALGEANSAYRSFIDELVKNNIQLEWRYYNDGKAWLSKGLYKWIGARGGQKEKTIFWLSIWDSFFKVTIYVSDKTRSDVLNLPLDDELKQMIENSQQMGKMKFFPIVFELCTDEMFEPFFTLVEFIKNKL